MEMNQIVTLLEEVRHAYPKFDWNEYTSKIWYKHFRFLTAKSVFSALDDYVASNKFPPHVSDLIPIARAKGGSIARSSVDRALYKRGCMDWLMDTLGVDYVNDKLRELITPGPRPVNTLLALIGQKDWIPSYLKLKESFINEALAKCPTIPRDIDPQTF